MFSKSNFNDRTQCQHFAVLRMNSAPSRLFIRLFNDAVPIEYVTEYRMGWVDEMWRLQKNMIAFIER
jgi:hypothetical protein